ncbi:MPN/PAD-1 domain-containing protein [Heterostelium album PN500]|uniref:MPN/PAD-1 domain-containing protein n=1 Tax=Heterostelium pallidum (strain ATCC 26659 / Pp 5 / PN500) TaxID=670386 RepID=D3BEY3_HETP5|nr:MPN/PAD-1 domain-containing protein [Heterostelium album PN500]EFA80464.1 MPN/PAD-1 domain-containing protein [Heterostelium album PN500]|eukprot:XP_020432584.1 MPN/PAD-1 domain-containing protein [Heterostelium album PN500]
MEKPLYLSDSMANLIANHVTTLELDKSYTIYNYLATLNNLTKQATIYKSEGDLEKAYIYLLRFCVFTLEKLPIHPDYSNPKFAGSREKLKKDAVDKLSELESMKANLTGRYKKLHQHRYKVEQERLAREREERERLEKIQKEQAEKEEEERRLQAELAEQKRLEQQRKRVEDQNQEERDLIKRRIETEKSLRRNRLEQQALLIRAEAELEERRQRETERQLQAQFEQQQQQHNPIVDIVSDPNSFIYQSNEVEVETPDTKSPTPIIPLNTDDLLSYLEINEKEKNNNNTTTSTSSNFLVDPTFATPPQQQQHVNSSTTTTIPSPIPSAPIAVSANNNNNNGVNDMSQYDSNHKFGYLSMDQLEKQQQQLHQQRQPIQSVASPLQQQQQPQPLQQQQAGPYHQYTQYAQVSPAPLSLPSPQQQQQQQQPPYSFNHHFNALPQYQPPFINQNKNQPQPTYLRSPQQQLPTHQMLPQPPPQHQHPQQPHRVGNALPNNTQTYLSLAQQQMQQQQQKNIAVQSTNMSPVVQTATTAAAAATSSPKPNIDSSEASKKYSKLRKVIIGAELFNDFMKMAENNTRRQIETCGILSGTLSNDVFKVTTLIIPKQEGTTDTCNTIEEHELFEYQLENDLLTLGWIHTHPTQDCFLSAVDVHTHCSYQYLLQEAIAVVISPMANPNFGIFRLTDPPGIQTVQKCKLKSFHPHPPVNGVPIYTKVDHVEIDWKKQYSSTAQYYYNLIAI